ncbi:YqcC family protein, partial [Shewanella sp. 0m-11]
QLISTKEATLIEVETSEKLDALEAELAKQDLLSLHAPSLEALASTTPFACDVMPFEHWLQFIFLPKMRYMLDNNIPLPKAMAIAPMAQHVWASEPKLQNLISILTDLDALLSQTQ